MCWKQLSKQRVTILICANMSGTVKRQLLLIGKSRSPSCFKNTKSLPVKYTNNRKAWMAISLFEEERLSWDQELQRGGRKVTLLLDNYTAHPHLSDLRNIELFFLPSHTTSVLQPMGQRMCVAFLTKMFFWVQKNIYHDCPSN